ncbi:alpha/beta fold hydrolase [Aquimarina aquimarini]|uniref:alpha/beta fold hydrolase n=1 Tax=Aquimarina aquimarini TaxID=1191734 RepID=UPI000D55722A|nr:alpha/beta hydrolase [Aquimarina aquimarini]
METVAYTEKIIEIDGFRIAIKIWGDQSGTPVLAIHGWLDNANSFDKLIPLLSNDICIVAIDLAGHGWSDHRTQDTSYYLWDYAVDALKVIEKLGWKKCIILAHSMGTGVASIIAGAMPNKVTKLIFIDGLGAPFVVEEENIVTEFRKSVQQLKMARKTKLYGFSDPDVGYFKTKEEAVHDRMDNVIGKISYDASLCLVERSLIKVSQGYRWRFDPRIVLSECYRMTEQQAQLFIKNIQCETLIVLGKQGLFADGMYTSRIKQFKNATVHQIDGGHHLHLEEAYRPISTYINQFLKI